MFEPIARSVVHIFDDRHRVGFADIALLCRSEDRLKTLIPATSRSVTFCGTDGMVRLPVVVLRV